MPRIPTALIMKALRGVGRAGKALTTPTARRALAGGTIGGGLGYFVTPHITGYADVPQARRQSAIIDALMGATLGGLSARYGGFGGGLKAIGFKTPATAIGAAAIGELPPHHIAKLIKERQTAERIGTAAQQMAQAGIPAALQRTLTGPTARGAGVGAAGAGLAAILSGLMRRRSEREMKARTTRGRMIGKDFLKYLIPAMVAGGVAGSFVPKAQQQ